MKIETVKKVSPVIITLETEEEINSMYHALLLGRGTEHGVMSSTGQNRPLPKDVDTIGDMHEAFHKGITS